MKLWFALALLTTSFKACPRETSQVQRLGQKTRNNKKKTLLQQLRGCFLSLSTSPQSHSGPPLLWRGSQRWEGSEWPAAAPLGPAGLFFFFFSNCRGGVGRSWSVIRFRFHCSRTCLYVWDELSWFRIRWIIKAAAGWSWDFFFFKL